MTDCGERWDSWGFSDDGLSGPVNLRQTAGSSVIFCGVVASSPAITDNCRYARDGVCDEPQYCSTGTDWTAAAVVVTVSWTVPSRLRPRPRPRPGAVRASVDGFGHPAAIELQHLDTLRPLAILLASARRLVGSTTTIENLML